MRMTIDVGYGNNEYDVFTLCKGRHETPCNDYIFEEIENPMDFNELSSIAYKKISKCKHPVVVYVTGLTPALVAVINACAIKSIPLSLMHHDRESGDYKAQEVVNL